MMRNEDRMAAQRVGMLKKKRKFMSKKRLNSFASGIFYSKLNYCLPFFANVSGLNSYKDGETRFVAFT